MQKLRESIKSSPLLWATCLLPALLFMLSMQLHIHVHTDHQHNNETEQHNHQISLNQAHLGNTHHAEHGTEQHHHETGSFAIDISPEWLNKSFSSTLLACILIGIPILLVPRQTQGLVLKRYNERAPYIRWRIALPPQLRAPPR